MSYLPTLVSAGAAIGVVYVATANAAALSVLALRYPSCRRKVEAGMLI